MDISPGQDQSPVSIPRGRMFLVPEPWKETSIKIVIAVGKTRLSPTLDRVHLP
jgi:hypothetical protein